MNNRVLPWCGHKAESQDGAGLGLIPGLEVRGFLGGVRKHEACVCGYTVYVSTSLVVVLRFIIIYLCMFILFCIAQ